MGWGILSQGIDVVTAVGSQVIGIIIKGVILYYLTQPNVKQAFGVA